MSIVFFIWIWNLEILGGWWRILEYLDVNGMGLRNHHRWTPEIMENELDWFWLNYFDLQSFTTLKTAGIIQPLGDECIYMFVHVQYMPILPVTKGIQKPCAFESHACRYLHQLPGKRVTDAGLTHNILNEFSKNGCKMAESNAQNININIMNQYLSIHIYIYTIQCIYIYI